MKSKTQKFSLSKLGLKKWTVAELTEIETIKGGSRMARKRMSGTNTCPINSSMVCILPG